MVNFPFCQIKTSFGNKALQIQAKSFVPISNLMHMYCKKLKLLFTCSSLVQFKFKCLKKNFVIILTCFTGEDDSYLLLLIQYILSCFSRILVKFNNNIEICLPELVLHYEPLVCSGKKLQHFCMCDLSKLHG